MLVFQSYRPTNDAHHQGVLFKYLLVHFLLTFQELYIFHVSCLFPPVHASRFLHSFTPFFTPPSPIPIPPPHPSSHPTFPLLIPPSLPSSHLPPYTYPTSLPPHPTSPPLIPPPLPSSHLPSPHPTSPPLIPPPNPSSHLPSPTPIPPPSSSFLSQIKAVTLTTKL